MISISHPNVSFFSNLVLAFTGRQTKQLVWYAFAADATAATTTSPTPDYWLLKLSRDPAKLKKLISMYELKIEEKTDKAKNKKNTTAVGKTSNEKLFVMFLKRVLKTKPASAEDVLKCDSELRQGRNVVQRMLGQKMEEEELVGSKLDIMSEQFNTLIRYDGQCKDNMAVLMRNVQSR